MLQNFRIFVSSDSTRAVGVTLTRGEVIGANFCLAAVKNSVEVTSMIAN